MKNRKKTVRAFATLFLSMCMMITMLPTEVWASEEETACTGIKAEAATEYDEAVGDDSEDKSQAAAEDPEAPKAAVSKEAPKAAETGMLKAAAQSGDFGYSVNGTEATITEYNGHEQTVNIPSKIGNYTVTAIGPYAFDYCVSIEKLTLPGTIKSIDERAFFGCMNLSGITIPSSVKTVEPDAFGYCSGMTSISVASGNTVYDSRSNCNAIIRKADNELVSGCKNTVIPNSVKSIGDWAFYFCEELQSIDIPESVETIGKYAFASCISLTDINNANGLKRIGQGAFKNTGLKSISIPPEVTFIDWYAFEECENLESITIPAKVSDIRNDILGGCAKLTSIRVESGNDVYDSRSSCNAIITKADNKLIAGCSKTVIPDGVVCIGAGSFNKVSGLKNIIIPGSVNKIEDDAFYKCTGLKSMVIPGSVTVIAAKAFNKCDNLTIYGCTGSCAEEYAANNGIAFKTIPIRITAASVSASTYTYSGKAYKPAVKITDLSNSWDFYTLKAGRDYTVSYSGNVNVGKATVTIKGNGFFAGKVTKTFRIVPKPSSINKLKSGRRKLTVTMGGTPSSKGATAYQIAYRYSKTAKWKYTTTKTSSKVIKKLKKRKKYYVMVRAYKNVGGTCYYGAWSKTALSKKIK